MVAISVLPAVGWRGFRNRKSKTAKGCGVRRGPRLWNSFAVRAPCADRT